MNNKKILKIILDEDDDMNKRLIKWSLCIVLFIIFVCILFEINKENFLSKKLKSTSIFNYFIDNASRIYIDIFDNQNNNVVYSKKINVSINDFDKNKKYEVSINLDNNSIKEEMLNDTEEIEVSYISEGKNSINIKIYEDETVIYDKTQEIYYVENYKKQFLDKLNFNGISTHYGDNKEKEYNNTEKLVKSFGIQYVRTDFFQKQVYNNGIYDFSKYDKWVRDLTNNTGIKILCLLNGVRYSDYIINSNEEVEDFFKYYQNLKNHYPYICDFEILNEINANSANFKKGYFSNNDMQWYVKLVSEMYEKKESDNLFLAGITTALNTSENESSTVDFYDLFNTSRGFEVSNDYNIHPYASNNFKLFNEKIQSGVDKSNEFGGFNYLDASEYGSTVYFMTEEAQAYSNVIQSVYLDNKNYRLKVLYALWTNTDVNHPSFKFGIVDNEYHPRPSYYSMKKYYENTNGSEYIGTVTNVADGLEFYVYDKDGDPLIICWSSDKNKTIEIPYSGFIAYDLYGNVIENTDGNLDITISPVYLKNADRSYFYRAISNTAVSAYDEFLTNYSDYLDSSDEMIAVKNEVNKMKKYAEGLANGGEVSEAEALSKMKEHFAIGDMILKAYKDEKLSCEYVKLSSMLDQLNTIGYAFEDLVTITAKDVSKANLTATEKIMNIFDNKVSANVSVEMVYPNKIKAFAKDYYDTSSYINGLEEENPIKNGLIISKGLHAYYLAGWADSFADCYLETPEITIQYSNTELTNEDVVVTLESNVPIEMEGSNQYTFTENGSFTFKYILYGEPKEITAVVDWIDKDAPVISGIDEREDETEQVTLNVTDANLDTITVTKDGQNVSFSNGDILIEKGEYEVVAKDRAGNSFERSFKIVDYIESNKIYYVSSDGTGDGSSEDLPMNVKDLNKLKLYAGDKILLKSGEKYSVNIECKRKGSPDNRVVISNYGEGALPVINGSLDLVSNLEISNLRFTNNAESCLVTNYDYCENVKIENCIFDNVADSAIYLNRQVSNFEITNCIFKNCKNAGITMKNDSQNLMVNSVKITNNIFVNLTKSIDIASEVADNTFENVEIGENYFIVQTSDEAVIKVGKIVTDKFEVSVYSNLFYSFSRAYEVFEDSLNDIKGHLLCDYNTFYAYKESKYLNDISDIKTLGDEYGNEANSNVTVIDREKYDVYDCLNTTLKLDDKEQILSNLTEKIDVGNRRMQVDVVGSPDRIIKNKVMGLDEMKNSDIEEITDSSVADEVLPLAGWQKVSIAIISIIVITGLFSAGKYSKYKKDTKKQIRRK